MTAWDLAPRLASALITGACMRLPEGRGGERAREWQAELAAILEDPAIGSRARRQVRAVRFAAGQRRTMRRLTRPTGAERARQVAIRAAVVTAAAAIACGVAVLLLDPVASRAYSDSAPIVAVEIWIAMLAAVAGLACTALVISLGLARASSRVRQRRRRRQSVSIPRPARPPARRMSRTGRAALVTMVAGVVFLMVGGVAGMLGYATGSGASAASTALSDIGGLAAYASWASLGLALILGIAAIARWLWRLARHIGPPRPRQPGRAPASMNLAAASAPAADQAAPLRVQPEDTSRG
jgi:hypothetical protein